MRSYSVQNLVDRARRYADMQYTPFIENDPELLDYLNVAYAEYYDLLVATAETYFTQTANITLSTTVSEYDLPADFYKMTGVDYQLQQNQYFTLMPYMEPERNTFGATNNVQAGTVRIRYVPAPAIFADFTGTIDGQSGWEDYIPTHMAIQMLNKEESDTSALAGKLLRLEKRIQGMAQNRDQSFPAYTVDINRVNPYGFLQALRYRLISAGKISIISTQVIGFAAGGGFGY
jgi:hypothetical protein